MTVEPSESGEPGGTEEPSQLDGAARLPSREYRTAAVFVVGGLLTLVLLLLYQDVLPRTPPIRGVVYVGGVVLGMLAMLAVALGLASRRRWAATAMTPMLLIVVLGGAAEFVWAISQGSIAIPFHALLALWALRAPAGARPEAGVGARAQRFGAHRLGATSIVVVAAMLVAVTMPVSGELLLRPGGPLIASAEDLVPALTVTCDAAPGVAPAYLRVAYDWRWARREPFAAGTDTITILWRAVTEDDAAGYQLDALGQLEPGIAEANVLTGGRSPGRVFSVDLATRGFEPGTIQLSLAPTGAAPAPHGSVEFEAAYLHAPGDTSGPEAQASWRVDSDTRCEW